MKKFIVWYECQDSTTEGELVLQKPQIIMSHHETKAIYQYIQHIHYITNSKKKYKDYTEFKNNIYLEDIKSYKVYKLCDSVKVAENPWIQILN